MENSAVFFICVFLNCITLLHAKKPFSLLKKSPETMIRHFKLFMYVCSSILHIFSLEAN